MIFSMVIDISLIKNYEEYVYYILLEFHGYLSSRNYFRDFQNINHENMPKIMPWGIISCLTGNALRQYK